MLDLARGRGRGSRHRPEAQLGPAPVAAARADRCEHDRGARGRAGRARRRRRCAARSPAESVVFVFVVAALLTARGWLLLLAAARESARRDPLTGVYDEPHLHDQLRRLAAAARQYDEPFALVLLHVPRRSADDALRRLVGTARELDLVAQLADGRLAVVLPRTRRGTVPRRPPSGFAPASEDRRRRCRRLAARRHGRGRRRRRRAAAGGRGTARRQPHPRPGSRRARRRRSPARRDGLQPAVRARGSRRRSLPDRACALAQGRPPLPRPRARARAEAGGGRGVVPRRAAARARHARRSTSPRCTRTERLRDARRQARAPPRHAWRRARPPDPVRGPRRADRGRTTRSSGTARDRGALRGESIPFEARVDRGRERDHDDDRAGRRRAAADLVAVGDLAARRRALRPRGRQRALPARARRADRRGDRGGSSASQPRRSCRPRARGASRSPCAAPRSCPRRSRGSSGRGRGARSRTRP